MESKKTVKVKYFSDRRHYTVIEVAEDEVEQVRKINRMTWREEDADIWKQKQMSKNGITICSLEKRDNDGDDIEDKQESAEEKIIAAETNKEEMESLKMAIAMLEPKQQDVVRMVYFEGKTQREIAMQYGVQEAAISKFLARTYAILKKIMKKH